MGIIYDLPHRLAMHPYEFLPVLLKGLGGPFFSEAERF